ncbi:MAG TPA: N-acetylmuramoyl-L-alanine amidase [Bryobacteraceae bacterium]|jgi:N-acetylmuramoyl-L-alanine amidase
MKRVAVLSVLCWTLGAQSRSAPAASVTAVRHWSLGEVTRIAVEVSGDFHYRSDRLHNPERIYFDIVNARNGLGARYYAEDVSDPVVKRIRAAEASAGITRVVIDLAGDVRATTTQLANPGRLIIELRGVSAPVPATPTRLLVPEPDMRKPGQTKPPPTIRAGQPAPGAVAPEPLKLVVAPPPALPNPPASAKAAPLSPPNSPLLAKAATPAPPLPNPPLLAKAADTVPSPKDATRLADAPVPEVGKAARRNADGETSLIRALGLKLNRVVIDPGHGGHDQGTAGVKGLLEKDLVLDVAMRAGSLIEERLKAEVIYTRSTDVFIPLESRTALANEKKADLFISIHANASSAPNVSGVETYYLNFTEAKDALAVAARENANSVESISELRDLIQKITLHDKAEESRDLAGSIQSSLFALYLRGFPAEHDRGVRRAPFVVLIGATMPSVLAEIGFLSNPKEEGLLRKPEYRQKVAEALVRGVEHYASGLSHFQVAQNK